MQVGETKDSIIKEALEEAGKMLQSLRQMKKLPENKTVKMKRWLEEQDYRAKLKWEANGLLAQKKLEIAMHC